MVNNYILCIETSTEVCSVAISTPSACLAEKSIAEPNVHGTLLTVLIEDILKENQLSFHDLSAVAYSNGPGSYTGLRIGLSVAKGICYGLNIPLIAIPTLQHIAAANTVKGALCFPMLDARRMEVYAALLDEELDFITEPFACIVDTYDWTMLPPNKKICFAGNGVAKSKSILQHIPNAYLAEEYVISARSIGPLAQQKLQQKQFADLAYHVPFYLKEAHVTVAKKKIL